MAFYNRQYFFLSFFLGGIQNDAVLDLINTVFHLLPQHILGRSVVSLYTVQLVFYISASLSLGETSVSVERTCAVFTTTWMTPACIFILRRGGAWGSPSCVAFREFPYKEERIILFCRGAEGQVMGGWGLEHSLGVEKSQRTHLVPNAWSAKNNTLPIG